MTSPQKISVIMGIYNSSLYLQKTLDSLLAQTYKSYELICINDGSTDNSLKILQENAAEDSRITIINQPENKGIAAALNEGINQATGTYIAIADSDDVYLPQRLEKQAGFLDSHPDHIIVGASRIFINDNDRILGWEPMPESDSAIRWRLFFNSPFLQPCVMLRSDTLRNMPHRYNPAYRAAEDYDLWSRLLNLGLAYNFKEPLVLYRKHESSLSQRIKTEQRKNRDDVSNALLKKWFGDHNLNSEQINRLRYIFFNKPRFFDTEATRPFLMPQKQDLENYFFLLRKYLAAMPPEKADLFLCEEINFLGYDYLSRLGIAPAQFLELLDKNVR